MALSVKKQLVEADEKEFGCRKRLNFGHTIGHALETYGDYTRWSHGEAVAMGMVWITRSAERAGLSPKGTTAELVGLLERMGLPTESKVALDDLMLWISRDKKKTCCGIELALMIKPGESFLYELAQEELYTFLSP